MRFNIRSVFACTCSYIHVLHHLIKSGRLSWLSCLHQLVFILASHTVLIFSGDAPWLLGYESVIGTWIRNRSQSHEEHHTLALEVGEPSLISENLPTHTLAATHIRRHRHTQPTRTFVCEHKRTFIAPHHAHTHIQTRTSHSHAASLSRLFKCQIKSLKA